MRANKATLWTRKELQVSSAWTSITLITQSLTTFFSLNWREMDLMDGLFVG